MAKKRYLTKSRFKLAVECPTKLFYTGKAEYANQNLDDSFLLALADGGFQVGELAKCCFPDGHDIKTLEYDSALARTRKLLQLDQVTIYEAAVAIGNLFIRVDILVKDGVRLSFYEVKSKSFDPNEKNPFVSKKVGIKSDWKPYLCDAAFQKYVISLAYPEYAVSAYLMMVDKTAVCRTKGLNQKFLLVKDRAGRKSVRVSEKLTADDLKSPILCKVNVDAECRQIYTATEKVVGRSVDFRRRIELFADCYASDTKIPSPVASKCSNCEFYTTGSDEGEGLKSGKKECWRQQLRGWEEKDFENPTVLDVWNFRKKDQLIETGRIKMSDITREDVTPCPDNKPGISSSERQWLQIEKYQRDDNTVWLEHRSLQREMDSWVFPLHFIDFETAMVAIPFNAGRSPYEGIAFQFSHHAVYEDGTVEHFGEYLNTDRGVFPNYDFLRALKFQLENDSGSIFCYSHHENTFLNIIYNQLRVDPAEISDRVELCAFIRSITQSAKESREKRSGTRNMVDMLELVKRYYYDPATNGSNSIKHVLPAVLNSSGYLKDKYSKPVYGTADGIKSHNFEDWQWVRVESGKVVAPYKTLPKMFQDVSDKDLHILSDSDILSDGGAALTAYARMQFEEMTDYERQEIRKALLQYCELDSLAMVMLYEGWKDLL